ncbi:MAG: TonB-dependent receptor, partial [Gammaproteobacteria bacterium]|nr:TonB-dependent receptor [Gammaproteobacteria bacterium]
YMRGTNSTHILTMIDGIKLHSATLGGTSFQHIPLSQIERIEIVRGPRSGLYGSEAVGGVIQIFTRSGKTKPAASFSIGQGSNNTSKINAGFSGRNDKLRYSLFASQFDTDGIDAKTHTTANDKDGYDRKSISSSLSYTFNKEYELDFKALNTQGTTLYDGCWQGAPSDNCYTDIEQQTVSTKLKFTPKGIWDASLQIGQSKDLSDNFFNDTPNNTFLTETTSISFQNNVKLSKNNLIIAGIDGLQDKVNSTPYTEPNKTRDNNAVFVSWKNKSGSYSFKSSLRTDDNEQFGLHSTGTVSAGYKFKNKVNAFASYGTAFKAPSFNNLYYPGSGDPDLLPEESESIELGLKQKNKQFNWELSIYNTQVKNLIVYVAPAYLPINVGKADITGLEITAGKKVSNWNLKVAATYLDPLNKDAADFDNILPGRTKQTTQLSANRQFGKLGFSATVLRQGIRFANADNSTKLDAYNTVDLKLDYKLSKHLTVDAKLNNAFDEDYVLNSGYNTLGRTVFVSMNYKM